MRGSSGAGPDPPAGFVGLELEPLRVEDLDQVLAIEETSFASPWNKTHFLFELRENPCAMNWAARCGAEVLGYACAWLLCDELKLNNIAVRPDCRGQGLGSWIVQRMLEEAAARGCNTAQLEVRPSNVAALRLYGALGFVEVGRRKRYYEREGEDAIVMEAELG